MEYLIRLNASSNQNQVLQETDLDESAEFNFLLEPEINYAISRADAVKSKAIF